jgi:histidine triad (HIT) family protein
MQDNNCVFCKIINKEIPAIILLEDKDLIVIQDARPSAPVHHLIIPKKHILSVAHLEEKDAEIIGKMFLTARDDAKKAKLTGYKTVFNVGRDGGQIIDHLHLHLLGGWKKQEDIEKMLHPDLDK